MRKTFGGYYTPTEEEFSVLWEKCLFTFDANVLLNMYRYSLSTTEELFGVFEQVSGRIWISHHAALEYHQRRLDVIEQQEKTYEDIEGELNRTIARLRDRLLSDKHPFVEDADQLVEKIENLFKKTLKKLGKHKEDCISLIENDKIKDRITKLFDGKVGSAFKTERLDEIYKDGKKRYDSKIPPGYEDVKSKQDNKKYGDLIIWLQIIEKAKAKKTPVIFITDEKKDDWWLRFKGKIIGPRPELVEEISSEADVSFYMYRVEPFLEHVKKFLERQVQEETIEEVRELSKRDETFAKYLRETAAAARSQFPTSVIDRILASQPSQMAKDFALSSLIADQSLVDTLTKSAASIRSMSTMQAINELRTTQSVAHTMAEAAKIARESLERPEKIGEEQEDDKERPSEDKPEDEK